MFFGKSNQEELLDHFTYFLPSPPSRNSGFRDKELDQICNLFLKYSVRFDIYSFNTTESGAWVLFKLYGKRSDYLRLCNDPQFSDFNLHENNKNEELEIISEGHEDFNDESNYQC